MPDRLTLEEAKAEIQAMINQALKQRYVEDRVLDHHECATILNILNRVQLPDTDKEGQAVLWLIREKKKPICITDHGWELQQFEDEDEWYPFNPIGEARWMGWGGAE